MAPFPIFWRYWLLLSIERAEKIKGSPPNVTEIYMEFQKLSWIPGLTTPYVWASILNIYREDSIYIDKQFEFISLTKDGPGHTKEYLLENFSERFNRLYPGYELRKDMTIKASAGTRTVKLTDLENMLRSKDEKLFK